MYLWEKPDWPAFIWDERSLTKLLTEVSRQQGRSLGKMEALGFELRSEVHLRILTEDVVEMKLDATRNYSDALTEERFSRGTRRCSRQAEAE